MSKWEPLESPRAPECVDSLSWDKSLAALSAATPPSHIPKNRVDTNSIAYLQSMELYAPSNGRREELRWTSLE